MDQSRDKEEKNEKKIVSVVLCSIMTAALVLTGCGKSSDSSSKLSDNTTEESSSSSSNSKYKKEITIDVFDAMANYQGVQSGWFAKVVKEKFNMKLNIIAPNVAGGGDTLFQTRSTAGNLGDLVIIGTENGKLKDTVKAGLLKDMSKLLKGKDVMKNYKMAITKTNELTGKKGVYAIPSEIFNQSPNASTDGSEHQDAILKITLKQSLPSEAKQKIQKDLQSKSNGAETTIENLQKNKQLAVGTGTSHTQPEESSDISTLRNQCKSTIVDSSWKMIFAKDEAEFNSILKDMQKTVKGLGYDKVLKVDMKNAKDKAASAKQALKDYNAQKKSK